MATTNHVRKYNVSIDVTPTDTGFRGFWELTRALKKAGWKYKASSDGTTKETTGDPALDKWIGTGATATNTGASAASIAAPTRGRATVTGLTGIVATDKGRFLVITGGATAANNHWHQIEEIVSSTSVRIDARNFAVASDANNGTLTWSIVDPMAEAFANFATPNAIGWWCGQGPSVLKIPITAASSGTFIRGENVTQTTTGAQGELVGYTYYNATGWLVIAPRLRGTGTGVHGWDTGNVITGAKSGATITQNGTALDYVHEVVFIKPANQTTIQIFVTQANTGAEAAELFSALAGSAGATATVAPGGGGTGNTFPTHGWVMWGTNTTAGTGVVIGSTGFGSNFTTHNIICVDALPEQNYSADGSWTLVYCNRVQGGRTNPIIAAPLYGFHRLNDTEDGEISLYVSVAPPGSKTLGSNNRTSGGTATGAGTIQVCCDFGAHRNNSSTVLYAGWKARGLTAEAFVEFTIASQAITQTTVGYVQSRFQQSVRMQASAVPQLRQREKIWLTGAATRMYKGTFRWMYWVSGGQIGTAYGVDPGWVQLGGGWGNTSSGIHALLGPTMQGGGTLVVGPHDGTQLVTQAPGG